MPALSPEELRKSNQAKKKNNVEPPKSVFLAKKHKKTDKNENEEEHQKKESDKNDTTVNICDQGTDRKKTAEEQISFRASGVQISENLVPTKEHCKKKKKISRFSQQH